MSGEGSTPSPTPTPTPTPAPTLTRSAVWIPGPSRTGATVHLMGFLGRTKITTIKVIRLTFNSDHHVITDNDSDWEDSGSLVTKPEWEFGKPSKPASYTKKSKVTVAVDFDVYPKDAGPTDGEVTGTMGSLEFKTVATFQGGVVSITATSTNPIPDSVATLSGDIKWSVFSLKDGRFDAGSSWGHKIYVTYGTPSGSAATEHRIAWSTTAARTKSSEQDCVDAIFDAMLNIVGSDGRRLHYTLGATPPDPPWKIMGGDLADCGLLADAFKLACLILGLPDKFVKGFIYPLIAKGAAKFSTDGLANEKRSLTGAHQTRHGSQEKIGWQDHSGGKNNFEGCVQYSAAATGGSTTVTYYCIGEARYSTPEAAMGAMVVMTFWGDMAGGGGVWKTICKNPGPFPVAKW